MLDKIYHKLLWILGFQEGEHISDLFWRQKERWSKWWWTGLGIICFIILTSLGAFVWLVLHILKKV